ncbi:tRNA (adenosine(37)-N6)-threonylcarbamoyltransferase complex ATPase subunit type 1 TsaE [Maribacter hydrothermalis]|uniref:tRNA threonylcarbamoyladenosine biosynthesis protein TsaE n=1 Tax=Maribacter hydrothermalis TaxID=1836467 RepID=A0A1B7Z8U2_9FLAO|nr:tRNA (adenosine(37)-N6)-threonylcarbamoyltransferase complex ATPase subunit type 1 TsaE [Maribacter hydrothermalis]APQ18888.1 tRNA (adenosine(37)-N6)-threonylcarbamoyltransferase complex ATPase subunit type 1 TsaE [Maribacter hydrothermalis]OBR39099.1 tRNA (N6-adenosine(37)-N6)-threonylcarbamoyltransferase complex ATPase TsaE [Maribacter hydrothermalis]
MEFIYGLNELRKISKEIIKNSASNILAFYAPMGAGKTTLIKALVKELDGQDNVSSPTFGLVNEYAKANGELLGYHFDFYRLEDENEALDMGLEDYLSTDAWVFMEWPEKIPNLVPPDAQIIIIEIIDAKTRKLTLQN